MTQSHLNGKSPEEVGMKKPKEGVKATMFLLFHENVGAGSYFGSDANRSPLDRYCSPGYPEYVVE